MSLMVWNNTLEVPAGSRQIVVLANESLGRRVLGILDLLDSIMRPKIK